MPQMHVTDTDTGHVKPLGGPGGVFPVSYLLTYNSGSITATYAANPTGVILALPQAMRDVTLGIYPSAGSFALYVTTADDPATTTDWANTDTVFSTASVFSIGLTITGIKVVPQASGASATFRVRG